MVTLRQNKSAEAKSFIFGLFVREAGPRDAPKLYVVAIDQPRSPFDRFFVSGADHWF
jgi:hypothetical protein